MPASPIQLKNSFPDLDMNSDRRESLASQASRSRWRSYYNFDFVLRFFVRLYYILLRSLVRFWA